VDTSLVLPSNQLLVRLTALDMSVLFNRVFRAQTPNLFVSVVSTDGMSEFWFNGNSYSSMNAATPSPTSVLSSTGGIRYWNTSTNSAIKLYDDNAGTSPSKALNIYNNQLFVSRAYGACSPCLTDYYYTFGRLGSTTSLPRTASQATPYFDTPYYNEAYEAATCQTIWQDVNTAWQANCAIVYAGTTYTYYWGLWMMSWISIYSEFGISQMPYPTGEVALRSLTGRWESNPAGANPATTFFLYCLRGASDM
jgi:hypothetical protein